MHVVRRTIRDDRGDKRKLTPPPQLVVKGSDELDVVKHYDTLARTRASHASVVQHVAGSAVLLALSLFSAYLATMTFSRQPSFGPNIAMGVVALCALAAAVWWPFRCVRTLRDLERRRAHLPPICPSCAYDLSGSPSADDGCTVCPECGGAWRFRDPAQS